MNGSMISATGLLCSITASLLFGLTPWYVQWLSPLDGMSLFWSRIIFSTAVALLFLLSTRKWPAFRRLLADWRQCAWLAAGTLIVATQWWLFVWAPINGLTTELSLGYFLLPLTLVLSGRFVYKEEIRGWQKIAIVLASIGVAHELWAFGSLSWVPILVAGTYPLYFMIRKRVKACNLTCFFFENLLLFPLAVLFLSLDNSYMSIVTSASEFKWLLPGLGILCTSAMLIYVSASRLLPVSLFGLLSYIEPALIFFVAVAILGEPVSSEQWLTYGFIGLASLLICFDSIRLVRQAQPA